jgi:hypothetical protein
MFGYTHMNGPGWRVTAPGPGRPLRGGIDHAAADRLPATLAPPPDRRSGRLGRGIGITLLAILGAFCGGMAGTALILVNESGSGSG